MYIKLYNDEFFLRHGQISGVVNNNNPKTKGYNISAIRIFTLTNLQAKACS